MLKRYLSVFSISILCFAFSALPSGKASAVDGLMRLYQLSEAITTVRTSKPSVTRTNAAERLADLAHKMSTQKVGERTLANLIALLDTPDDSVRFWVATALGNLGPQAEVAIPALEKTLAEVDCLNGAITSAAAVRQALTRLGVTPPPRPKCGRVAG